MGIGAACTATSCALTNIRKKDDKLNYAIGCIAAAGGWGLWQKSYRVGVYGGLALALASIIFKDSYENNWIIYKSDVSKIHTNPYWVRQDWSIIKDPGRTWRRSADE